MPIFMCVCIGGIWTVFSYVQSIEIGTGATADILNKYRQKTSVKLDITQTYTTDFGVQSVYNNSKDIFLTLNTF